MSSKYIQYMNKAIILITLYFIYDFLKTQWISYSGLPLNTSFESKMSMFGLSVGLFIPSSVIMLLIFGLEKYRYYILIFLLNLIGLVINHFILRSNSELGLLPISILLNIIRLTFIGILYINFINTKNK
jgi:uncharacterized membrane protein